MRERGRWAHLFTLVRGAEGAALALAVVAMVRFELALAEAIARSRGAVGIEACAGWACNVAGSGGAAAVVMLASAGGRAGTTGGVRS